MTLPTASRLRFVEDLLICRILNGMWQVSGTHGRIDPPAAIGGAMLAYHDAGFTAWDLADHYGPAEDFTGKFRRRLTSERGDAALSEIQAFTKWTPRPESMTRQIVENNVYISLRRMGGSGYLGTNASPLRWGP
jgi:aryl-alcohol dehydrogenase-like predicted oxidoreductase